MFGSGTNPFANLPYWTIKWLVEAEGFPRVRDLLWIRSPSTARRAGSPAGNFTKIRNVRIEMMTRTRTE